MPSNKNRELAGVMKILQENQRMNFVQRILKPQDWPALQDAQTGKDGWASHAMSWTNLGPGANNQPIVYPTVVYDAESKSLKRLGGREAVEHAIRTGEFIAFPDDKSADWFSRNYKLGMGGGFAR